MKSFFAAALLVLGTGVLAEESEWIQGSCVFESEEGAEFYMISFLPEGFSKEDRYFAYSQRSPDAGEGNYVLNVVDLADDKIVGSVEADLPEESRDVLARYGILSTSLKLKPFPLETNGDEYEAFLKKDETTSAVVFKSRRRGEKILSKKDLNPEERMSAVEGFFQGPAGKRIVVVKSRLTVSEKTWICGPDFYGAHLTAGFKKGAPAP